MVKLLIWSLSGQFTSSSRAPLFQTRIEFAQQEADYEHGVRRKAVGENEVVNGLQEWHDHEQN